MKTNRIHFNLKIEILILFPVLISMAACSYKHDQNILLQRADVLMKTRPDSALWVLEGISQESLSEKADKAYYALLLTQARDKNGIAHSDTSLIYFAVSYYVRHNQARAAKSHYYLGRIYQDMGSSIHAVRHFTIALALTEKSYEYELTCSLLNNLGKLYGDQELFRKADSFYHRAEHLATLNKDSVRLPIILTSRGEICMELGHLEKAEPILLRAYSIALLTYNTSAKLNAQGALSSLYSRMGKAHLAKGHAKNFMVLCNSTQKLGAYLLLGDAHFKCAEYDSAHVCFHKSLISANHHTRLGAYMRLSEIALAAGDYEKGAFLKDSANLYRDFIHQASQAVGIVEAQKDIESKFLIRASTEEAHSYRYLFLALLFLLTYTFHYFLSKRKKYQVEAYTMQKKFYLEKGELQASLKYYEGEVARLHGEIDQHEAERKEKGWMNHRILKLEKGKKQLIRLLLEKSEFKKTFDEISVHSKKYDERLDILEEKEWTVLIGILCPEDWYPESCRFREAVLEEHEIRFCCVLRMGYSAINTAGILGYDRSGVYYKIDIISAKLGYSNGTRQFLDDLNVYS